MGSTSRTYIKYVTVAMRDIDSGRPNIALLTELNNAVSKVLKRHFFSENINSYALICMFTNRKFLIGTYKYVMHQLVSMNLYVLQKNIQSNTYEWTLDKLNVNRQWSVLIGKYKFVCYAEKHTNYYLRMDIR